MILWLLDLAFRPRLSAEILAELDEIARGPTQRELAADPNAHLSAEPAEVAAAVLLIRAGRRDLVTAVLTGEISADDALAAARGSE